MGRQLVFTAVLLLTFYVLALVSNATLATAGGAGTRAALLATVELIDAERFSDAVKTAEVVLQLDPENPDALHLLAVALLKSGSPNVGEIARLVRAAIAAAAQSTSRVGGGGVQTAQYYNTLGLALMESGDAHEALSAFDMSLEVSAGRYTSALYNKGNCLMSIKQYERAATHWQRMLHKDPGDVKARLELGATLREAPMQDYTQSQAILESLLRERPGDPEVAFQLGVTIHVGGRPSEAIQFYQHALELDGGKKHTSVRRTARFNIAAVQQEQGQFEQALHTLEELIEEKKSNLSKLDSGAFNNAGACHWQLGNTIQAFEMYSKALELNPENKEALVNLGVYFYELGDLVRAKASYEKAIEIERVQIRDGVLPTRPVSSGLKVRKALLLSPIMISMEDIAEARASFARAILELSTDSGLVLHNPVRDIERTHFYLMCMLFGIDITTRKLGKVF